MDQEIKQEFNTLIQVIQSSFSDIEKRMATKDDLRAGLNGLKGELIDAMDEKLGDLKGDLVLIIRKEDRKLLALVDELLQQGELTKDATKRILSMEPFPQLSVS